MSGKGQHWDPLNFTRGEIIHGVSGSSLRAAMKNIGHKRMVRFGDAEVLCHIGGVKPAYGKVRILAEPVHGQGSRWVDSKRLCPER